VREAKFGHVPALWRGNDAVDMECYAQARAFHDTPVHFHCLKFSTDYSDRRGLSNFNAHVQLFSNELKSLLGFIEESEREKKVSVIIPVYNRPDALKRAVRSVLHQTHPPEEIIIVDDGSTDITRESIRDFGSRITALSLPKNAGVSRARNRGIQHAKTEWIALLDSDDCWEKDKLKNQLEYLWMYPFNDILQSEETWIRSGVRVNPCLRHRKPEGWIWEKSLERCLVSPSAVLLRKTLLERYGYFDESLPACEDYDLWLKISRHHPVGLDSTPSVVKYGGHEDQLSLKYPAMDRYRVYALLNLLEKELLPEYREQISSVLRRKLRILIGGSEKREKLKEAREYGKILESLGSQKDCSRYGDQPVWRCRSLHEGI
jgi:glycosyltransferase involved in cell wall biosynthesis